MLMLTYFLLAVGVSFLCSILEAVLLSITPSYIELVKKENSKLGKQMQKQKKNIDYSIAAILTLNTFAHTLGAAGVGAFVYKIARHYYLQAGYTYEMTSDLDLLPNLLIKSDGQTNQIDVNAVVMYQDKFWGGLSYRFQDAIAPMAGVQMPFKNGFWKLGYSYDVTTSRLAQNSSGSHEIMLGICLPYSKPPTSSQHRTVRFL